MAEYKSIRIYPKTDKKLVKIAKKNRRSKVDQLDIIVEAYKGQK